MLDRGLMGLCALTALLVGGAAGTEMIVDSQKKWSLVATQRLEAPYPHSVLLQNLVYQALKTDRNIGYTQPARCGRAVKNPDRSSPALGRIPARRGTGSFQIWRKSWPDQAGQALTFRMGGHGSILPLPKTELDIIG